MLKLSFVSIFFLLATLSNIVFTSPVEPRDIHSFEQCLHQLSTEMSKLESLVGAVGNTLSYQQAFAINKQVDVVKGDLNQCRTDLDGVHTVRDGDVRTVIGILQGLIPTIVDALDTLVKKEEVFARLPFAVQRTLSQLEALNAGSKRLEATLNALTPPNYKRQAANLEEKLDAAFDRAIKAYSS